MSNVEVTYPSIEAAKCPFPLFAQLRHEAPVYQVPGTNSFLVTRWEDIRQVCHATDDFTSDSRRSRMPYDAFGDANSTVRGLLELDPPAHKARRDACRESLTPTLMRRYEPMVREITDSLIDAFIDDGRVELVSQFSSPLPMRVMMNLFGFGEDDVSWVKGWSMVETSGSIFLGAEAQERQRSFARVAGERMMEELVDRYENPREDVLSDVVARNVELLGHFDAIQIRADAANLFRGGIITVAHAVPMAMHHFLQHPDQMAELRADPAGIPRAFEEALRLDSPSQWDPRIATRDTEIGGVAIPEGSYVMVVWASGSRDEDIFDEPEEFKRDRQEVARHLSFGYGPHFCVGAPLGRLEAKVAFEHLFARLSDIRYAPGTEVEYIASPKFRGLTGLELEFNKA